MPVAVRPAPRQLAARVRRATAPAAMIGLLLGAMIPTRAAQGDVEPPTHLVVSEVVTGGASASDELIEIHNPSSSPLLLDGLEVVYVTASGATVSRRAAWGLDAGSVSPHAHLLIANEAGIYAPIADATYASGMASTGGSVAIRIQGAATAIDAAGWGTTTSTWREGPAAPAPAAGSSIERLPGGALGSGVDTDLNAADFVVRLMPEPQNLASAPTPSPGPTETPGPVETPGTIETPGPTAIPTPPAPTPAPTLGQPGLSIADARALPDGSTATIEGVALAGSDFHDGGGFVADASGGIAVLVTDGAFPRGVQLRLTGEVDDRFSQRTLRVDGAAITILGTGGVEPSPTAVATGAVGEAAEGRLVRIDGIVTGAASVLTSGLALDIDDGSGATRVVVGAATGIDASGWTGGTRVDLVGIVGQRDSSGEGTAGYRVLPRDSADVKLVGPAATPAASGSPPQETAAPTSSPEPAGVSSIADARAAARNSRLRVRGVVTLAPGTVDTQTAAIQDASGAIVLRLGDDVGRLVLGERVEVRGTRSTKSGMETLRVTEPALHLGTATPPASRATRTGEAGEPEEARLVTVRGALTAAARRSSTGSVTFDIDDGSGPLKIALGASLQVDPSPYTSGTWVEVTGVLGQDTTGAQPTRGYRVWPRGLTDVRIVAVAGAEEPVGTGGGGSAAGVVAAGSLDRIGAADLAELTIGATLVVGPWPELGIGGLLWDGTSLVAIDERSTPAVAAAIGGRRPPLALRLSGLTASGRVVSLGIPRVILGTDAGEVLVDGSSPAGPRPFAKGTSPGWAAAVGPLIRRGSALELRIGTATVRVDHRCAAGTPPIAGSLAGVTGIAVAAPARLVVPCGGVVAVPLAHGRAAAAPVGAVPRAAAPRIEPNGDGAARPIASGLLGVAALGLGGLVGLFVRRRRTGPEPSESSLLAHEGDDLIAGPRLALVRMRREPGP